MTFLPWKFLITIISSKIYVTAQKRLKTSINNYAKYCLLCEGANCFVHQVTERIIKGHPRLDKIRREVVRKKLEISIY